MPSWRLINELFFKSFTSRPLHEPSAATGCSSLCTSTLLDGPAARHTCERSLAPARETTISWVQLPSGSVSRDHASSMLFRNPRGTDGSSSKQARRWRSLCLSRLTNGRAGPCLPRGFAQRRAVEFNRRRCHVV